MEADETEAPVEATLTEADQAEVRNVLVDLLNRGEWIFDENKIQQQKNLSQDAEDEQETRQQSSAEPEQFVYLTDYDSADDDDDYCDPEQIAKDDGLEEGAGLAEADRGTANLRQQIKAWREKEGNNTSNRRGGGTSRTTVWRNGVKVVQLAKTAKGTMNIAAAFGIQEENSRLQREQQEEFARKQDELLRQQQFAYVFLQLYSKISRSFITVVIQVVYK
jgi:hypothetical protein